MAEVVIITEAAAFQIKDMMKHNEEEDAFLRVGVNGGGCSGLTYGIGFEHDPTEEDVHLTQHGIPIVVAKKDAPILGGTKVDYQESLMGGGFIIENPNAIASCGCGTSFRTAKDTGAPADC